MTIIALAKNEKADIQIEEPVKCPTPVERGDAVSRSVDFAQVRALIEASRPLRRPNRNRPENRLDGANSLKAEIGRLMPSIDELDNLAEGSSRQWFDDKSWTDDDH